MRTTVRTTVSSAVTAAVGVEHFSPGGYSSHGQHYLHINNLLTLFPTTDENVEKIRKTFKNVKKRDQKKVYNVPTYMFRTVTLTLT